MVQPDSMSDDFSWISVARVRIGGSVHRSIVLAMTAVPQLDSAIEIMSLIRKGQIDHAASGDVVAQTAFIERLFGIAA